MRRIAPLVVIMLVAAGALAEAPAASALGGGSVGVIASVTGNVINAQASGTADLCSYDVGSGPVGCSSEMATIAVAPASSGGGCFGAGSVVQSQVLSTTSGAPFTLLASVPESGGSYVVCAYIAESYGGVTANNYSSSPVTVSVPPQPCASGTQQQLTLAAPSKVAINREGAITVGYPSQSYDYMVSDVLLTITEPGYPQPLWSHTLTGSEVQQLQVGATSSASFDFSVGSVGAAQVGLSYVQSPTGGSQACVSTLSAPLTVIAGKRPLASFSTDFDNSEATISFAPPGGCQVTAAVPVSVSVSGHHANLRAASVNPCSGGWQRAGRIPGVSFGTNQGHVTFRPSGANEKFRVTVRVRGQIVKRGWLSAVWSIDPGEKIWDGTDEFVNDCIDSSKTLYSQNGRLYCWLYRTFLFKSVNLSTKP